MKKKLKQVKLPYQIEISDVIARSGFVAGAQGVTEIIAEGGLCLVKRENAPDLLFSGAWYGVTAE